MGEWHGNDLNAVWRNFLNPHGRVRHTPESRGALQAAQVADLRRTAGRYLDDPNLQSLITELRRRSTRFNDLWESGTVAEHQAARKTVDHPHVGALTLDCDVLGVAGSDLRIMVYTARPGTEDADRLALLNVVGHNCHRVTFGAERWPGPRETCRPGISPGRRNRRGFGFAGHR